MSNGVYGDSVNLYRSISDSEALDIAMTGGFSTSGNTMACKQFGLNYDEVKLFGKKFNQSFFANVEIPKNIFDQLYLKGVDTTLFRSGTVTVYEELLDEFNKAIIGAIKIFMGE